MKKIILVNKNLKLYTNKNNYNFEINNNMFSNIITKWKQKSNRFP